MEKRKKQWLHSYFYSVFWLLCFERNKLLMKEVYSTIMFLKTQLDLLQRIFIVNAIDILDIYTTKSLQSTANSSHRPLPPKK